MVKIISRKDYSDIHSWIRTNFGDAKKCSSQNCSKKSKKFQWALKTGHSYDYDINNFLELCLSCHKKYDLHNDHLRAVKLEPIATMITVSVPSKVKRDFIIWCAKERISQKEVILNYIYNLIRGKNAKK